MVITSVEKSKKNKGLLSVFVDDRYAFSIPEEDYLRLCLYEKKEISDEEIEFIKKNVTFKTVKSQAVKYLSYRLIAEAQLFDKLKNKGYDEDIIWDVINELKSIGYINDLIYAEKYVYDRVKLKPKSKKMLKMELLSKGVSEDIADQVINEMEFDEDLVIDRLIRKKFGKYDIKEPQIEKKIYYFLLHRGFSRENIRSALNRITNSI
ncbi:MAG TPA: RecX family transcriptional regulator [Acetivibrio sp.]|nr:regulatory protein RecX [Clostridium sp.]HOQ38480.1 RecX family transcriptional regulator [Acetivibrio sp.]HPT92050.1 RecX family transcriptional regulator [Acetivibrio sp.]